MFFNNSVKLSAFEFEHATIHFSSDFIFIRRYTNFQKRLSSFMYFYGFLLGKILELLQCFQYTKIYEAMENVDIALFCRICVVAARITMRFLILEILCRGESLISIFHFLCKTIVSVYYSVYLPLLLSKRILSCSLGFIKFLIMCTLGLIILFLRFLFYLVSLSYLASCLYLIFIFVICDFGSNLSYTGIAFDVNASCMVSDEFKDFTSFLIFLTIQLLMLMFMLMLAIILWSRFSIKIWK